MAECEHAQFLSVLSYKNGDGPFMICDDCGEEMRLYRVSEVAKVAMYLCCAVWDKAASKAMKPYKGDAVCVGISTLRNYGQVALAQALAKLVSDGAWPPDIAAELEKGKP